MNTSPPLVALLRCSDYELNEIESTIQKGMSLLGGLTSIIQPGEHLLLKPNLLAADPPEKNSTTHPLVFESVARYFLESGVQLTFGDSPAAHRPITAARRSGISAAAEQLGIPLAEFGKGEHISFPDGKLIKQFSIVQGALDADGIVNICKMKAHALTRMTGAVKNMFGCVPGTLKAEFHAKLQNEDLFSQMLIDLNRLLPVRLHVMDAIMAMEGNGPRNGSPRPVQALLFSMNPFALDTVAAMIMNLDPDLVPTLAWAKRWELFDDREIEIVGESLDTMIVKDFKVNRQKGSTSNGRSGFMYRFVKNSIAPRPVIEKERCTKCGTCVDICPVKPKALQWGKSNHQSIPVYDYDKCIRCYCCQETCPSDAIKVLVPPLGRLIH